MSSIVRKVRRGNLSAEPQSKANHTCKRCLKPVKLVDAVRTLDLVRPQLFCMRCFYALLLA